jgi:hypothetical protein
MKDATVKLAKRMRDANQPWRSWLLRPQLTAEAL